MHLLQPDEAAIKSLQIARFRQTCAQFGATFRHSHAHAHTQSHSHGAMEPWSHETPESSAKKNLLGQLRAPVGVGVALAALKCRPAVCHNFPLFFFFFLLHIHIPHCCCTWQFAICNSDLWICTGREGGTSNGQGIIWCGISTSMRWQAANWPNDLDGFYTIAAVLLEGKQV